MIDPLPVHLYAWSGGRPPSPPGPRRGTLAAVASAAVPVVVLLLLLLVSGSLRAQAVADSAWNAGDLERAAELYEARLGADSTDVRALHRLALIRAWNERFDESLRLFDRLLELDPDNLEAMRDRGRVLGWSGDLDAAVDVLDRVLSRQRDELLALQARATFRGWQGDVSGALADYERIQALSPGDRSAGLQRARLLSFADSLDRSAAVYDSLLREDPDNREARLGLARVLSWDGRLDCAEVVYRGLVDDRPTDVEVLGGLARVLSWRGELGASERVWRRALERDPDDVDALLGLARTLRWEGREAAALEPLRRAREAAPGNADVERERGWVDAGLSPRLEPTAVYEGDSDDNRIYTARLRGAVRIVPRLELGIETYGRRARNRTPEPDLERESAGGLMELALQLEPGWWIGAGGGVTLTEEGTRQTEIPSWRARVSTPRHEAVSAGLRFRREALDLTARLVDRAVVIEELSLSLLVSPPGSGWRIRGSAAPARYEADARNERLAGSLALERQLSSSWTLGVSGRAFGFDEDLNDGYFDPDFYGLAELLVRWERYTESWRFVAEAAPGGQQVGSDGEITGAFRLTGRLGHLFAPGRELSLTGAFSSTGLQSFSTGDADYRYGRVSLGLRWAF